MPSANRFLKIAAGLTPAIEAALRGAAEAVADDARARVPVETGKLKRAIHVSKTDDGFLVVAGDNEAWYGHMVEHGTSHSAPEPFLVPALEENRGAIIEAVRAAIREAV